MTTDQQTHILNYPVDRARAQWGQNWHIDAHPFMAVALPASVDLRTGDSPIYDQGQLGSCTANAVGALCEYLQRKENLTAWVPSRLFIYYQERLDMGTVNQDSGASIAESLSACANYGFPPETDWPYNISQFTQKPPTKAYDDALQNKVTTYAGVSQNLTAIKTVLAGGFPVDFGFNVYQQYESVGPDGMIALPSGSVLGGHANLIVGYDDSKQCFLVRNSWGTSWGMQGYGWFPYAYMTNGREVSDLWTASVVSGGAPPPPPPPPVPTTDKMRVLTQPVDAVVGTPAAPFAVEMLSADGTRNVSDQSSVVTSQLVNATTNYSNMQNVRAVDGVCTFKGDTFTRPHPASEVLHYVFSAAGMFSINSASFVVTGGPPPPPPPPGTKQWSITTPDAIVHKLTEQ